MGRPKRFHIAIGVSDLVASRTFYTRYFQTEPSRVAVDQIDWILDDPAVNFSIFFNPQRRIGPEHFGLDLPSREVPGETERLGVKDAHILDPDGIRVEVFSSDK
ncbi:MAG TPA: hypothetical protein VD713_02100 [Sphingomonadales bacterium]|nr:hypothetical protein [Sphingomonadales bacterium]